MMKHLLWSSGLALAAFAALGARSGSAAAQSVPAVHHRTAHVAGVDVFYREAGPAGAPVVLLLHGFPASSHQFRNLIPALADRYHVIAPDYPGFGQSAVPPRERFAYTFDHLAEVVDSLVERLGVRGYTLYVMDFGAPVGYRLALKHPERVQGLIVQNGNAYAEGLMDFWNPLRAFWADPTPERRNALRQNLTPAATRWQYLDGVRDTSRVSPDAWELDQRYLDRPGVDEIMLDLFYDYRTNLALYPRFQEFFRTRQPPTLIVWGRNDQIFPAPGAEAYRRDLRNLDFHLLDTGHFALEEKGPEIAALIRAFLARNVKP